MPPVRRFQLLRSEDLKVGPGTGRGSEAEFIIRTDFKKRLDGKLPTLNL
jgi:hypothetical protein